MVMSHRDGGDHDGDHDADGDDQDGYGPLDHPQYGGE